ncbi:MAG: hypothetical protein U9Q76_04810, partial [candidate division WOR-3 bacterium]|nr:hypothetical protein [candidate division WOR-3 bacterium]
ELTLDPRRVKEILADVTGYSDKVFFGLISGLIENEDEIVEVFKEFGITKQRPDQVFEAALKELK